MQNNENPYLDLRNLALSTTAAQLGLNFSDEITALYGMVMDWGLASGSGTATLTAFVSGDASIYLSSGGGFIGGGQHETVANAAKKYVEFSKNFLATASQTTDYSLAEKAEVKFYFLTNKGVFTCSEQLSNIENKSSSLTVLFEEANKVFTEIRLASAPKTPGHRR